MKKIWWLLLAVCLVTAACVSAACADGTPATWAEMAELINGDGSQITITLVSDITAQGNDRALTIPAGKTVTIDLGGHTLTRGTDGIMNSDYYMLIVSEGAECTIQGPGTMTDQNAEVTRAAMVLNQGTLTLDGASLTGYSLCVENTGTVTMDSGSMTSASNGTISSSGADSSFTMNGGSITDIQYNWADCAAVKLSGGSFTMNGGTISDNDGRPAVWNQDGGTVTINGGTIADNDCSSDFGYGCVYCRKGNFVMTGGSITGNTGRLAGGVCVMNSGCTFTMTGGSITGNTGVMNSSNGGGVYCLGTASVSGNVQITGNFLQDGEELTASDWIVTQSAKAITVTGPLASTARIGLRSWIVSASSLKAITSGLSTNGTEANFILEAQREGAMILFYEGEYVATSSATVSIDANGGTGGTASVSVPMNIPWALPACDITAPASPAGIVFEGWWYNNELKQPGDMITISSPTTLQARWLTTWGALKKQIEAADAQTNTFTEFELDHDITAASWDQYINIRSGQKIILDLSGHTMDCSLIPSTYSYFFRIASGATLNLRDDTGGGKLTGAVSTQYYPIENEGHLMLIGGSITGNVKGGVHTNGNNAQLWLQGASISGNGPESGYSSDGTGVYYEGGSFNMSSGEISGNTGTGVMNISGGEFRMSGGSISDNGGFGVYSGDAGYLEMSGGTITGNATGVHVRQIYLSGMVTITGNRYKDVELLNNNGNWIIRFRDALDADARIGVFVPAFPYTFTSGLKTNGKICATKQNFINTQGFCVTKQDNELVCIVGVKVTYDANGGSGETITEQKVPDETWVLPECPYTAPRGKLFDAWEMNGTHYAPGDSVSVSEAATVKALWVRDAANSGTWAEVQAAIDAGGDTVTFTLTKNMYGDDDDSIPNITIPAGKTVTLDLNGFMLDRSRSDSNGIVIEKGAALTILDGSDEKTGLITNGRSFYPCITNHGTLTLESGTIEGSYDATVSNNGVFTMNGGTVRGYPGQSPSTMYIDMCVHNTQDAQMTLNGGTVTGSSNGWGVANGQGSVLTINGGTISENHLCGVTLNEGATMVMNGGIISGNGYPYTLNGAVYIANATCTITGGTIRENYGYYAVALSTYSSGTSTMTITGGSIEDNYAGGIDYEGGQLCIGGNATFGNNESASSTYSCDIRMGSNPIAIVSELSRDTSIVLQLGNRPQTGSPLVITDGFMNAQGVPQAYVSSFNVRWGGYHRILLDGEIAFAEWNEYYMDDAAFVLPADLTTIEAGAFTGIDAEVIVIPRTDNEVTIGSKAFANCYKLRQIYLPENVTSIAADAFDEHMPIIIFADTYGTAAETFANSHANIEYWTKVRPRQ